MIKCSLNLNLHKIRWNGRIMANDELGKMWTNRGRHLPKHYPSLGLVRLRKLRETSITIAGLQIVNGTLGLPNSKQKFLP
jgi:hypothetical protein